MGAPFLPCFAVFLGLATLSKASICKVHAPALGALVIDSLLESWVSF